MTFEEARSAHGKAWLAVGEARVNLRDKTATARAATLKLRAVCPHNEGFEWDGFGSEFSDANRTCRACGVCQLGAKVMS